MLLSVLLVGGALGTAPARAALAECPQVMPVADVAEGMMGTGYTVSEGTTPEPFTVEILGVLENGIGPGRDMIIVDVSNAAIEQAGGIWFGMSGSPVYINGKFVGAVAYGLSFGPSTIGGLTPAEDMLRIADRPTAAGRVAAPAKARLTDRLRARIASESGVAQRQVGYSMKRLATPLSISGVGSRVMDEIEKTISKEGLPLIPYSGASASAVPGPSDTPPEAGGNFAAAISYGDVTLAGVGTTSYVCDGKVLAFGHPFFFLPGGETTLGGNNADAIAIVSDPVFGAFKLANITGSFGEVDQDRFAGIRAIVGDLPTTIPITSHVETADGWSERDGQSDALVSEYVPMVALSHILSNIDFTRDEIDEGTATASWTITGKTASGEPWALTRSNMFADEFDVNYMSLTELEQELYSLYFNEFEDIEFTGVDYSTTIEEELRRYTFSEVLVSTDGVNYVKKRRVHIERGGDVFVRVVLEPYEGTENVTLDFTVDVPFSMRNGGYIQVSGGQSNYYGDYYCFEDGSSCASGQEEVDSFLDLVDSLESAAKNNELVVSLYGNRGNLKSEQVETLDQVVSGFKNINVFVGGGDGSVSEGKPPQG